MVQVWYISPAGVYFTQLQLRDTSVLQLSHFLNLEVSIFLLGPILAAGYVAAEINKRETGN